MPSLIYPTGDFQPFTKILSSEVNGKFNAIKTLLNVTKLDFSNVQTNNLLYSAQLTNQAVITNATGNLTTSPTLPIGNGGLGFSVTFTVANAQQVIQVNSLGTALTLDVAPQPPTGKIYSFYRFN